MLAYTLLSLGAKVNFFPLNELIILFTGWWLSRPHYRNLALLPCGHKRLGRQDSYSVLGKNVQQCPIENI